MSFISEKLNRISPSQTIEITDRARVMQAQGKDVISLSAGEPDFDTPEHICRAAVKAIEEGKTRYTNVAGTLELRKAIAERFLKDSALDYSPEEIIVSTGGKQVIYNAIMATINPGDEVIIPAPAWVSYPDIVNLAGGKPVIVPCSEEQNFCLTGEGLRYAITPKTKWLILNSPNNPTGAAYTQERLKDLAAVLLEHPHIWVLMDDIYDKLVYDGFISYTMAQIEPRLKSRTVTMNGVSKAYAMTGWRIGYAGAPVELVKAMVKLQGQSTSNASSISQAAAYAAVTGPQSCIETMVDAYQQRRDFVVQSINTIRGLSCYKPMGAFYVFASLAGCLGKTTKTGILLKTDADFVKALLEEEGVATVHGSAFLYPGYFRISYATSMENLQEACHRIQRFCGELK
ncbi:pyridoxal phosphate-dependent aminotransferase [Entomobacter blattae]|uniref:Aminotransferase n=1 Tax=Entomobacter blattae TaxID=2762277 RepID=A0A7H1NTP9_9PROT|nr:pyridoxal phosphate-dependent aminotransferase [Entomobacter blattae]QNT79159.1 Aspartate aminotransferase [Entomobacter blattae]